MYEEYYELAGKPFQTNPDPAFYFGSRQHKRAMDYLVYGLHRNEGFIVITGEVGAGKTTLVRTLFRNLEPDKFISAHLVSTQLDAENALRLVSAAFGVPTTQLNKADLLTALEAFLRDSHRVGKHCLLVVDEAQNLRMEAVEELRMLSNFQLDTNALLQTILIGQPEFRHTLTSPQMTQLRQRVIAACHIGPLDSAETQSYIEHRLKCAGWKGSPKFAPEAFPTIHKASGGIPRRINAICDRLLLSGFLSNVRTISDENVIEIAYEMESETFAPKREPAVVVSEARHPQGGAALVPPDSVESLSQESLALRLDQVEKRSARVEAALDGLLRNNSNALALLGRMVDAVEKLNSNYKRKP